MTHPFLIPDWPAPDTVHSAVTTRFFGDLATDLEKERIQASLSLSYKPIWLQQVHETTAVNLASCQTTRPIADASYSQQPEKICAVLTADCLPILICNQQGTEIAALHAGWRGLLAGVIDQTIQSLKTPPNQLLAWLGPAIGPDHFEINETIRTDFIYRHVSFSAGFHLNPEQHWFADLYQLARINFSHLGVNAIYGGGLCTYCDTKQFYSYRRDQGTTGRMASLIWFNPLSMNKKFINLG